MSNRHVFNSTDGLVLKSLRGAIALNPALRLHAPSRTVYAAPAARSHTARVAVLSGGGAGHEPAHAGYTGRGMLAASVSGDVFASPSAAQVLTAIRLATAEGPTDVLLVINNYTGDRLNFGLATEHAHALGIHTASVVVADDVSLLSRAGLVGPRGLGGNILVCKILGAAAERGDSLEECKALGDAVVGSLASVGVGLAHCHVPGRAGWEAGVEEGWCEIGMGLHNEPGVRKARLESAEALVAEMLQEILKSEEKRREASDQDGESTFVREGDAVVLYVNNLGGMSQLEMGAIVDETLSQLASNDILPARALSSSYMTSLNAPGFSLSLLNLSSVHRRLSASPSLSFPTVSPTASSSSHDARIADLLSLLDAPTDATAWIGTRAHWPDAQLRSRRDYHKEEAEADALLRALERGDGDNHTATSSSSPDTDTRDTSCDLTSSASETWTSSWGNVDARKVEKAIRAACSSVLAAEPDLTRFDTVVGDGDCGETFASGARAIVRALDDGVLVIGRESPARLIGQIAGILENSMGGTSGALFGLYFTALSNALAASSTSASSASSDITASENARPYRVWQESCVAALEALSVHTPARPGDRTLVDALHPFCHALVSGEGIRVAAIRARAGADGTRRMTPRLGRATYVVGESDVSGREELPPDPGAWGAAAIVEGLAEGLLGDDGVTASGRDGR